MFRLVAALKQAALDPARKTVVPRITRLTANHRNAIRAHLLRLDGRGRFRRFTTPMPDRAITRYVDELDLDTGLFWG